MARKNRLFAKLASDVDTSGNLAATGIQSEALDTGVTVYATRASLPSSGNTAGDQAYVTENNRLYIWNGSGWYNIALLNVAPSIQSVLDSDGGTTPFSLAIDGTATTITITAADSDGDPITYTASADSDFNGLATITNVDNVFTITPFSQDSATTESGTITFTATDGVNVASSGVQTFTLSFVSALWDETVLSIGTNSTNGLANSTFIDRSTNAHTVTATGTPIQTEFHPYLDNWSVKCSAETFLTSSISAIGTNDYSIELWINIDDLDDVQDVFDSRDSGGSNGVQIRVQTNGTVRITEDGTVLTSGGSISIGQWHHIAVVRDSTNTRFYVDGTQIAINSGSNNLTSTVANLGHQCYNPGKDTRGYISNVRIVNGTAIYTSSFTPAAEKLTAITNTDLLACQSNRFIDTSGNDQTTTVVGSPKISAFNPFGQGSEYAAGENKGSIQFEANNQVQSTGSIIDVGTGDFTIEFWSYGIPTSDVIIDTRVGSTNTSGAMIQARTTGYRYQSSSSLNSVSGLDPTVKQWLHFAAVRNSGTVTIYHNGVGEQVTTGDTTDFTALTVTIGANSGLNYDVAEGYCSDLRITKSAVYTANFTPPTKPVGNTNASLYLPMDNAGIFDKTGNHTLTLNGDVSTSTTQTKFADTAIYFDGTGDKITTSGANYGDFGTGDFTIEFWMRAESLSGYNSPIADDTYASSSTPNAWCFYLNGTSLNPWKGGTSLMSGGTLSTNTWHHLAWTRSNGTMYLFLDGTQVDTTTDSTSFNYGDIIIGSNSTDYYLQGYLENIQILKGVAKYTTNFTPPTQEQGRSYQAES